MLLKLLAQPSYYDIALQHLTQARCCAPRAPPCAAADVQAAGLLHALHKTVAGRHDVSHASMCMSMGQRAGCGWPSYSKGRDTQKACEDSLQCDLLEVNQVQPI